MSVSFPPVVGILRQGQFTQTPALGPVYVLCAGSPHLRMIPLNDLDFTMVGSGTRSRETELWVWEFVLFQC